MRNIRQEKVPCQAWWLTPACQALGSWRQAEFETSLGLQETISKSKVPYWGARLQLLMSFPWRASLRKSSLGKDLQERRAEGRSSPAAEISGKPVADKQSQEDRKPQSQEEAADHRTGGVCFLESMRRYWSSAGLSCMACCGEPLRVCLKEQSKTVLPVTERASGEGRVGGLGEAVGALIHTGPSLRGR